MVASADVNRNISLSSAFAVTGLQHLPRPVVLLRGGRVAARDVILSSSICRPERGEDLVGLLGRLACRRLPRDEVDVRAETGEHNDESNRGSQTRAWA